MSRFLLPSILLTALPALCLGCGLANDPDELEATFDEPRRGGDGGWTGNFFNDPQAGRFTLHASGLGDTHEITLDDDGVLRVLDAIWVDNGRLFGTSDGVTYEGEDFVGSTWLIDLERTDDQPVLFELEIVAFEAATVNHPLDYYEFSSVPDDPAQVGGRGCPEEAPMAVVLGDIAISDDGQVSASPGTFTVACQDFAAAKAALWGYEPQGVVGIDGFQTAMRMAAADYCGDGVGYTVPGAEIMVKDDWGINWTSLDPALMNTEAGWSPQGATCLSTPRNGTRTEVSCAHSLPQCSWDPTDDDTLASWVPKP